MATTNIATDIQPLLGKERVLQHPSAKKENNRSTLIIALAILALVLVGVLKNVFKPNTASAMVLVVGAQKDLLPGTRIGYTSCHYLQIPKAYFSSDMMLSNQAVVGRVVKYFVPMGEPITNSILYAGANTISANFENDERAITLSLDDDALLDHSINPGDNVDILVTVSRDGKKYTKTIAQKIRVLMTIPREALGSNAIRSNERNHITLAVLPEQSELLTEAKEVGKIQLVLRNRLSTKNNNLSGTNEKDLLPFNLADNKLAKTSDLPPLSMLPPPPPLPANDTTTPLAQSSSPLGWMVDVFMGGKKDTISVPAQ